MAHRKGQQLGEQTDAIGRTHWVTALALATGVALLWSGVVEVPGLPAPAAQTAKTKHQGGERSDAQRKAYRRSKHDS